MERPVVAPNSVQQRRVVRTRRRVLGTSLGAGAWWRRSTQGRGVPSRRRWRSAYRTRSPSALARRPHRTLQAKSRRGSSTSARLWAAELTGSADQRREDEPFRNARARCSSNTRRAATPARARRARGDVAVPRRHGEVDFPSPPSRAAEAHDASSIRRLRPERKRLATRARERRGRSAMSSRSSADVAERELRGGASRARGQNVSPGRRARVAERQPRGKLAQISVARSRARPARTTAASARVWTAPRVHLGDAKAAGRPRRDTEARSVHARRRRAAARTAPRRGR